MSLRNIPGRVFWRLPIRFELARLLGPRYGLRCVLFHDVSDQASPFTDGMEVSLTSRDFEGRIRFLAEHYNLVGLDAVLNRGVKLPPRPVLVTFDDAYASVARTAAPICRKYGVRGVFFVNASLVENRELALDNLICYVANVRGMEPIHAAANLVAPQAGSQLASMGDVFGKFLPRLALTDRYRFRVLLAEAAGLDGPELARKAQLYVTLDELRGLAASGFEIANHTYSHVHCRVLQGEDFLAEIERNKHELEDMLGNPVRAFSVPYGFAADLTGGLAAHLKNTGHEAAFLVESRANTPTTSLQRLNRVSVRSSSDADFFGELEVLPRLRSLKDRLSGRALSA